MAVTREQAEAVLGAELLARLEALPREVRRRLVGGMAVLAELMRATGRVEGSDPSERIEGGHDDD